MEQDLEIRLNNLSDKLIKSTQLTEKETKEMFVIYNELFPNNPENSPGCGGCRMRVRKKLLTYITQHLNIKKINNEIQEIDPHMKPFEKINKINLKDTDTLVLKQEFKDIIKTIRQFSSHLTFDAAKVAPEKYKDFYNAGFYNLFDIVDINSITEHLNTEEINEANIELLEMNDPNITENKSVTKRKYNKKK